MERQGRGKIKVHTVRHTDDVPEGALSPAHKALLCEAGQEGHRMSHESEKLPQECPGHPGLPQTPPTQVPGGQEAGRVVDSN